MEKTSKSIDSDPMMSELRQIRDGISQHLSSMTSLERLAYYDEQLKSYAQHRGLELEPDPTFPRALRAKR